MIAEIEIQRIHTSKTHYEVLNVDTKCEIDEIKSKYKKLAILVHPDKCSLEGAEESFKKLNTAYSCLSKHEDRHRYDANGYRESGGMYDRGYGSDDEEWEEDDDEDNQFGSFSQQFEEMFQEFFFEHFSRESFFRPNFRRQSHHSHYHHFVRSRPYHYVPPDFTFQKQTQPEKVVTQAELDLAAKHEVIYMYNNNVS